MIELFAGLAVALAAALVVPWPGRVEPVGSNTQPAGAEAERAPLARMRVPLAGLALAGGWTVFGGTSGCAVGAAAAAVSWRALGRLESPASSRRRRELERDLPVAVHLLAACLRAGSAMTTALEAVSEAMPGAAGEEMALVQRRLRWGTDPVVVWRSLGGPLEELGRRMARAHESGASVQHAITALAEDLRSETRARAEARARTVEVRAAAPIGLCFLPAFVLLGVVPLAAGLFSSLPFFR